MVAAVWTSRIRVEIVFPADHTQDRDGLVSGDHELEPGLVRAHQALTSDRMPATTGGKDRPEDLGRYLTRQAQRLREGAGPPQRGLATGAVVVEGLAGVIVGPAQHVLLVVRHRLGAHHREPHPGITPVPLNPKG